MIRSRGGQGDSMKTETSKQKKKRKKKRKRELKLIAKPCMCCGAPIEVPRRCEECTYRQRRVMDAGVEEAVR